ncbi:hypothetical protein NOH45_002755 [Salmonella enterica]|nr:hypothetical protein [Salmonella enterica]
MNSVEPAAAKPVPATPAGPVAPAMAPAAVNGPSCPAEAHIPAGQEVVKAMVAQIRQRLNQPART